MNFLIFIFLLFFSTLLNAKTTPVLEQVKVNHGDTTTVNLEIKGSAPHYKIFTLSNPQRIVIDLHDVVLTKNLLSIDLENTPIKHLRAGHPTSDTLRIVLDLVHSEKPITTLESSANHQHYQLLIHLQQPNEANKTNSSGIKNIHQTQQWLQETLPNEKIEKTASQNKILNKPTSSESTQPSINSNNPAVSPQPTLTNNSMIGHRDIIIVIDPGHGGKDPGTTGSLGVHEKDIVLAISRDLRDILNNQPGFHPVLTRKRDYFIPLRGRLAIARKYNGDAFIAIHADAFKDSAATGASVFALSPHGASSEAARWLAAKENYSELGGVNLRDKSDQLRSVLIDLSQTATISSSIQLGSSLLGGLTTVGNLHYRNVEQAPFMVLKSPDIPSVLVETGFLSNPQEQRRLRNPADQQRIAWALANGIVNYFNTNPPPGTELAAMKMNRKNSLQ